jgi:hypothetical protein
VEVDVKMSPKITPPWKIVVEQTRSHAVLVSKERVRKIPGELKKLPSRRGISKRNT